MILWYYPNLLLSYTYMTEKLSSVAPVSHYHLAHENGYKL